MKNYKKYIAAALITALLFSCFGCGRKTKRLEKEVRASAEAFAEATSNMDLEELYRISRKWSGFQELLISMENSFKIYQDYLDESIFLELFKPDVTKYRIQKISVDGTKAEVKIEFTHSNNAALIRDGLDIFLNPIHYGVSENEKSLTEFLKNAKEESMTTVLICNFCKIGKSWKLEDIPKNYEIVFFSNGIQGIKEFKENYNKDLIEEYKKWMNAE